MSKIKYFDYLQCLYKEKKISQASKIVLDDYFLDINLANLKQKTIDYNLKIMIFVTLNVENDLDKLTQRDIKLFQQKLQESNLGEATQKVYIVSFKRFLRWYSKSHYKNRRQYTLLLESFVKRKFNIQEKTPADLLTEHEIIDIIEKGCKTARDKAIIAVLAESGCRVGEIVQCKVKDLTVNDKSCNLTFPKGKTGTRTVTLVFATSYLVQYLTNHHEVNTSNFKESPLFITERKLGSAHQFKSLELDTIRDILKRAAKRVGIKKRVYPHLFRHTRATQLSKKLKEAQMREYLGWSRNSDMPSYYSHLSSQDMQDAIHEMHGIIEKKDETGMKVEFCKKCKKPVPVGAKICYNCFTPLTLSQSEEFKQKVAEMFEEFIYNPERFDELAKDLKKIKDM